ncbi:hypothetical protein M9458_035087 [Cirrhinus mrigala]|uniref:Uncharacterized protein n=1 Tax=Cirrhinus mrigala TaxID=683832 RepID=A0ABD0PC56_CIRMR
MGGGSFAKAQLEDERLKHCWSQVRVIENQEQQPAAHPLPHFIVKNGLFYCERAPRSAEWKSGDGNGARSRPSIGPSPRSHEYHPAHPTGWRRKAVLPSLPDIPTPQPTHSTSHNRGTLRVNWNGPGGAVARGHKHILVIVDYATRYPEAISLRKATAKNIAKELCT